MSATRVNDLVLLSREYRPALMAFFLRRLHNHAEAEDLTQEVFVRLARHHNDELQCASAYVFHIASNLLRDRVRRSKSALDYRSSIGELDAQRVDTLDPYRIASSRDSIATMCKALGELNEMTRNVFVLYRIEGISKQAIAETFSVSVSLIEKHITRATAFLTERFEEEA